MNTDVADHPTARPAYRVRFYRELLNDCGARFRCTIATVEVRRARSIDRALAAAKRRFERRHRLHAWDHLAHGFESEELGGGDQPGGGDPAACR